MSTRRIKQILIGTVLVCCIVAGGLYSSLWAQLPPPIDIQVTADFWRFTPEIIHVRYGQKVTLHLESMHGEHGFSIPAFGVSELLAPGRPVTVTFIANQQGTFQFHCNVFCGGTRYPHHHAFMKGVLVVE